MAITADFLMATDTWDHSADHRTNAFWFDEGRCGAVLRHPASVDSGVGGGDNSGSRAVLSNDSGLEDCCPWATPSVGKLPAPEGPWDAARWQFTVEPPEDHSKP